ncbi:MAG: glycogen synthase GlgA [Deltaproteobacteria bacterium]|nr:glycogen synthase GlgA [Deltaproteobacteria bacterium]
MKILFVSPEAVPFAKSGGLADVPGALPRALADLGHEVFLFVPKYHQVDERKFHLAKMKVKLRVPVAQRVEPAQLYAAQTGSGLKALFLRKNAYYDRDQLYGTRDGDFEDNAERFTFFSRAVPEAALALGLEPDIIHCHDWQTGLVPVYLKTLYRDHSALARSASVFTIHNMGYQGIFCHYDMQLTNLGWELFTPRALEYYGKINFLKGGILFADAVTTVSRRYMEEIQTPEFGFGLDGVLKDRKEDLFGILNGVDYEEWSPEKDPFLRQRYSAEDLSGKRACKADLQREMSLPEREEVPLIGIISRLIEQKGFDLIAAILPELMGEDLQLVLLGTGEEKYHLLFSDLDRKYPGRIGLRLAYDNPLAHKIEAGADMFLMPSRYEPCGLNQISSLKYGTVPIVRATGGLDDTIQDFDRQRQEGNGFKFREYSPEALLATIRRALKTYRDRPVWEALMRRGMAADFSWRRSAEAYLRVYESARRKKGLAGG